MEAQDSLADYTAIDGALLAAFFMSYSVLALVQLNTLFNGRILVFLGLTLGSALLAGGFTIIDFQGFCADGPSAIICNGDGRGLGSMALIWVFVSAAMLGLFGLSRGIQALQNR